jgi:glutathione S-transferase
MKLYVTMTSPYARMVRIVVLEKKLEPQVGIVVARTRATDSPYYNINPSGRVPYLVRDDGVGMEESALIISYLDRLGGTPVFDLPSEDEAWEARRLEALARSMLDGLAVWGREVVRPRDEQSPTIIRHEAARADRMADLWEHEIENHLMNGALNLPQITLVCALGLEARNPGILWRRGHRKLSAWFDQLATRPSIGATAPPVSH